MTVFLITAVIVIDQVTKYIVANHVELHSVEIIHNFFSITYAENTGMAWSLMSGKQALLALAAAVAIGVMLWYLICKPVDRLTRAALALMIGGAAGNLIDRLLLNYVRDFLDFYIFGYDFPIFNVADTALTIGVILLILAAFLEERKHDKTAVEN